MYISHTTLYFNNIFILKFAFKLTLKSFKFFFCIINTHIIDLIHLVLIKIRFNIFIWFPPNTYFSVSLHEYIINCTVNKRIILLMTVKFISVCGIVSVVLSRPTFNILRTKVSQDLALIWRMPGAMDKPYGFGITIQVVYIYFTGIDIALTNLGVSIWQGGFYSRYPAVASMFEIFHNSFFIRRLYYTFVNRLCNLHAFKHINRIFLK